MGLDQYIYRVRKPKLEDRVYRRSELGGLNHVFLDDVKDEMELVEQVIPYAVVRQVETELINTEKIFEDYNMPENSYMSYMSNTEICYSGRDANNERIEVRIDMRDINEKYTVTEVLPCYIFESEEVQYWRKHYDLQDWIYNSLDDVQNTGYYMLDADLIRELNQEFDEHIPKEDPDGESALFYWEWY